jgi:hypothetical protein
VDPDEVADAAMQQYDQNQNGMLELVELAKCPGILAVIKRFH